MDPILVERTVRPGDTLTYLIFVTNEDRFNSVTLDVEIADVTEDATGNYRLLPRGSTPYSLERIARVQPERITVPAGTTRTVEVTVQVPRGGSGGRYGAVAFTFVADEEDPGPDAFATTDFTFRMASFLELVIEGSVLRREAYAASFELRRTGEYPALRSRFGDDAMVFAMNVANEGNVHIVTRGELTIRTLDGYTVARFPLGGGRGVILPDATVALRSVITRAFPPGEYEARAVVQYGGARPITASLRFTVDEQAVLAEHVSAEDLARFRVDPETLDLRIRPGSFEALVLEVTNRGDEPVDLEGRIVPLAFDLYGEPLPEAERGEAPDWIELRPASFRVNPGRSQRVRLTVRPPRDVSGGHYADIVFRPVDGGAVVSEAGSSLLIYVGDAVERKGAVEIVELRRREDALEVAVLFKNEGTVHIPAALELLLVRRIPEVLQEDGRVIPARLETVGSLALPAQTYPLLPGDARLFPLLIPVTLDPGEYQLAVRVDYGGDEPAITQTAFKIEESLDEGISGEP